MNANENLLYSIVLILTPAEETTVRATVGHQAHAAFLHAVREADPALAEVLHMPNLPLRPFTVSPLQGVDRAHDGRVRLLPGEDYWLRFTVLYPPIFEQFMGRFLHGGRPTIRLGQAHLLIREILVTPGSHPWAGYTTWGQLAADTHPDAELTLEFVTPTAFGFGQKAWGKKAVVLPDPALVFGSLLRAWNSAAPPPLAIDQSLSAYVDEHVVVKQIHHLHTHMQHLGKAPQVGFVGCVTYKLMHDDMAAMCQLNALADLAFYTGVGMKTAMGMGQTHRV